MPIFLPNPTGITALSVINKANIILSDIGKVRWPDSEMLAWLNDGQREVVQYRHDASVHNGVITLTPNSTKQDLPIGGIELLEIRRNMGVDGLTPGAPIRIIKQEYIDALVPTWHTDIGQSVTKNYCYDLSDPKHFYVYPRTHASTVVQVEAVICMVPMNCETTNSPLSLADEYANVLVDYLLYRAFSKDTDASDILRATSYYQSFTQGLGVKSQVDTASAPKGASV